MARVNYSEFSYGYAFTENLLRELRSRPQTAPYFPSLQQEGECGYDMRVRVSACVLFFQYKRPHVMLTRKAREISDYGLRGLHPGFFRMHIMKGDLSRQHELLVELDRRNAGFVFYATPAIRRKVDFDFAYCNGRMQQESFLFSPGAIGTLPSNENHHIAYNRGQGHGWLCSEPKPIDSVAWRELERRMLRALDSPYEERAPEQEGVKHAKTPLSYTPRASLLETADSVRAILKELVPRPVRDAVRSIEDRIGERVRQSETDRSIDLTACVFR